MQTFRASAATVKKILAECDEAKASGNIAALRTAATPKACAPPITGLKKAEAAVKSIFAQIDRTTSG